MIEERLISIPKDKSLQGRVILRKSKRREIFIKIVAVVAFKMEERKIALYREKDSGMKDRAWKRMISEISNRRIGLYRERARLKIWMKMRPETKTKEL